MGPMADPHFNYLGHWYGTAIVPSSLSFARVTSIVILGVYKDQEPGDKKPRDKEPGAQQPSSSSSSSSSSRTYHLCLQSKSYAHYPIRPITWSTPTTFTCTFPHWVFTIPVHIHGSFFPTTNPTAPILHLTFSNSIFALENFTVPLSKYPNSTCEKYLHAFPASLLPYTYRVPVVSPPSSYPFPPASASSTGLSTPDLESVITSLIGLDKGKPGDPRTDAILVLKEGKLVLEEYFWGMGPEDLHEISSCTKSIAGLLVGLAVEQGKVDIEDVVADAWPEIDTPWRGDGKDGWGPIKVKHLLMMCSGTKNEEQKDGPIDPGLFVSETIAKDVLSVARIMAPGEVWNYDNSLPFLVACYLEKKVGMSIEAFADEYFFKPLDIPAEKRQWTYLKQQAVDGKPSIMLSGGLMLRLRDFAKVGQMMLDGGLYVKKRVITQEWVRLATSRQTREGQWPYGFFWHLNREDQRHLDRFDGFLALGQGEQVIAVLPELKMVVCWMSSTWINNKGYRVAMKEINNNWIRNIEI